MTVEQAAQMRDRINQIIWQTLRGGNDPEDQGNVRDAVAELGRVIQELISQVVRASGGWSS